MIDDCRLAEVAPLHQFLINVTIFVIFFAVKNMESIIKELTLNKMMI